MLSVVGQVLIKVGKAVGVLAKLLVHDTVVVTSSDLPATGAEPQWVRIRNWPS
jgi:hypothetical protein